MDVISFHVELPDKAARARAASFGRKPMAAVSVELEDGRIREIVVPARVGRLLREDPIPLPMGEDAAFDAVHALEERVAFAMATEMLSRRDHAEFELHRKLRMYGFREQEIASALDLARSHRFVDDHRFAGYFIEERIRRGWGPRKIEAELKLKGIDISSIEGYPDRFFPDGREFELALDVLRRKRVPDTKAFERLVRHLLNRGFDGSVARRAVSLILEAHEEA